ncbi:pentapeptide repeat-containing protein [Arthrobacter sp. UYCu723]
MLYRDGGSQERAARRRGRAAGRSADLTGADLRGADVSRADLSESLCSHPEGARQAGPVLHRPDGVP